MATNELAAILARRRAKAGGESESASPAVEESAPPSVKTVSSVAKSSIAERIARLKQQSAAASAAEEAAAAPLCSQSETSLKPAVETGQEEGSGCTAAPSEGVDTSAVAAAQEAAGLRRASSKIQQLQGSLGINVNPFGRPSGSAKSGGNRQPVGHQRGSIMSTGEEQYGHTKHAMGVAMPGMMGSAIPMPGLTKREFRLPGMAAEGEQSTEASGAALDNSHTTMNRVAGPKRRGPMRPPPGAFRIPAMTVPRTNDVEPSAVPAAEPAVVAASALAQDTKPEAREYVAIGSLPSSVSAKAARSPATVYRPEPMHTPTPSTPVPALVAAVDLQKLPEPEPLPPMKPYEIQDDPFTPTYEAPVELPDAPAGFPSALMANFSMDELVVTDQPKPKPKPSAPSSSHSTPASSLFGATSGPAPTSGVTQKSFAPVPAESVETPLPAPAFIAPAPNLEQPASLTVATPALVLKRPTSPVLVPAPAPVVSSPTPTSVPVYASTPTLLTPVPVATPESALVSTPTPAAAAVPVAGPVLFSATASAASDDDDPSESDWSDDDDNDDDDGGQSLFGGKTAAAKPETISSSPTLVTPTQSTPECHHAPALSGENLFGNPSSTSAFVPAAASPGFVRATPHTTILSAPYSSLFGGAASSSESDSDDEGGLFGA